MDPANTVVYPPFFHHTVYPGDGALWAHMDKLCFKNWLLVFQNSDVLSSNHAGLWPWVQGLLPAHNLSIAYFPGKLFLGTQVGWLVIQLPGTLGGRWTDAWILAEREDLVHSSAQPATLGDVLSQHGLSTCNFLIYKLEIFLSFLCL